MKKAKIDANHKKSILVDDINAVTPLAVTGEDLTSSRPMHVAVVGPDGGISDLFSGGLSMFRSIDLDQTEEEVKGSAGQLYSVAAFNRTADPLYLKFYNAPIASVTVGTTTPVLTFAVPANADLDVGGFIWNNDIGFAFSSGISVACTTGVADSDTGAPGANACIVNIGYK